MNELSKCKNSKVGEYQCYHTINNTPEWSSKDSICVDMCLVSEIKLLWKYGVITTGCCCGMHSDCCRNNWQGYINVTPESEEIMDKLGYWSWYNKFGVKCFLPQSI